MEHKAGESEGVPDLSGIPSPAERRLRFVIFFALAWVVVIVNAPDFIMGLLHIKSPLVHSMCDLSAVIVMSLMLLYLLFVIKQEKRVTTFLLVGVGLVIVSQVLRIARVMKLLDILHGTQPNFYDLVRVFDEACNGLGLVFIAAAFLTAIADLYSAKQKLSAQQQALSKEILRRAQVEKEIAEERQKYKDLVNNLPVAVYRNTPGPDGRFLEMNAAHVAMLEADSEQELLKYNVSDLYRNPAKRKEIADKLLKQGSVRNEEVELITLKGRQIWGSVTAVVKHDFEGKPYFDGIIEDITARVAAEHLLAEHRAKMIENARLASLGIMAGGIAHEINNPLAVIAGCVEQLELAGPDWRAQEERGKRLLFMIRDNTFRIQKTIQGLRSLSRDASEDPFVKHPLASIIDDTVDLCRQRFRSNGVQIEVDAPGPELVFECRPAQVAQVLLNLLNNAFDAVRENPVKQIRLRAGVQGDRVEIMVEDNGPGFNRETAERLFVPFFTTKSQQNGLGLGLSISHAIVEAHHGEITADITDGYTRFYVRLPLIQTQPPANASLL